MITVVRHRDTLLDRGLQDRLSLVDGDLAGIDRQRDGIHKRTIISGAGSLAAPQFWRCRVRLVTLPVQTSVHEAGETMRRLLRAGVGRAFR